MSVEWNVNIVELSPSNRTKEESNDDQKLMFNDRNPTIINVANVSLFFFIGDARHSRLRLIIKSKAGLILKILLIF